jgi:short subunit dehydrogenase-like uncharacterized protein
MNHFRGQHQLRYDIVLLGATGYTGQLVARRLSARIPSLSWAIAGRNEEKLNLIVTDLDKTGRNKFPGECM